VLDPNGVGLLLKMPKGGDVGDIVWIVLVTGAGLAALSVAAQRWGIRRTTRAEQFLFLITGLLLVFPSLLEAILERVTGLDLPHPAPFGLALGAAVLLWQWLRPLSTPRPAGA
jgi:hypothetical protein